jgi:DNA-binding transcriptional ArsR family regulator
MTRDPFSAIADPTRREIIDLLSDGEMNINQISDHFNHVSRQAITKQIRYLEESGMLLIRKQGREKYCYLVLDNLDEVNTWIRQYEKFWNKRLDRLSQYLGRKTKK